MSVIVFLFFPVVLDNFNFKVGLILENIPYITQNEKHSLVILRIKELEMYKILIHLYRILNVHTTPTEAMDF